MTWHDQEHPDPVFDSTRHFDRSHHQRTRKCHLALSNVLTDAESETSCIQFAIHLQDLQRSRYVMNGRLDADARAHPDAVWGVRPDAMSHGPCVGGRSAVSVRQRNDEGELKRSSGLEFSQGAHTLPAVRRPSPRLPSDRYHCIVPDSHVAVGAFVSNDGRSDDCDWRRYVRDRETLDRNAEYIAARNAELHELNSAITAASDGRDANRRRRINGDGGDGNGGDGNGGEWSGRDGNGGDESGGDGRGGGSSLALDEDTLKSIFAAAAPEEDEGADEDAAFDELFPTFSPLAGDGSGGDGSGRGSVGGSVGGSGGGSGGGNGGGSGSGDSGGAGGVSGDANGDTRGGTSSEGSADIIDEILEAAWGNPALSVALSGYFSDQSGIPDFWGLISDDSSDLNWLDGTCWAPRKKGPFQCDSADYVDTKSMYKLSFIHDWEKTSGGTALSNNMEGGVRPFGVKTMSAAVCTKIRDALEKLYPMLLHIFSYYACIEAEVIAIDHD